MQPYHLLVGIGMTLVIGIVLLLWGDRPELAEAIRRLFTDRPHHAMSSEATDDDAAGTELVHVPGLGTGTARNTSEVVPDAASDEIPGTDAAEAGTDGWAMPHISTTLSDDDVIVMLAAQRTSQGKWRFSANKIFDLVGGSRAAVLAQVKAIQAGTPPVVYPPRTPEQQAAREELGLPPRS